MCGITTKTANGSETALTLTLTLIHVTSTRVIPLHAATPRGLLRSFYPAGDDVRQCILQCRAGPESHAEPFPNPADYLSAPELAVYERWTRWSVKPAGLDYLQPRPEYFRSAMLRHTVHEPGISREHIRA